MFTGTVFESILASSSQTVTILGIDPGTSKLGIGVLKVRISDLAIVGVDAFTLFGLKPRGFEPLDTWMLETHSEKSLRIRSLMSQLTDVLDEYRPNYVGTETPFINMANPSAFGPLVEVIQASEMTVFGWNHWRPFYRIETTVAKKSVYPSDPVIVEQYKILAKARNAKGKLTSSKEKVQFCVRNDPELAPLINFEVTGEDAIDAVVVAKAILMKIRNGNLAIS